MSDNAIQTECALFESRVGDKVIVELSGVGERFSSEFIGWDKGRYILIKLPPKLDCMDHVYADKPVIARYLRQGGEVHAFATVIVSVVHTPFRFLVLEYPKLVETLQLRKMRRVKCFFPTDFHIAGCRASGYLLNISLGGARGCIENERHELEGKLLLGEAVSCRFRMLAPTPGEAVAEAVPKKIQNENGKHLFSLQFISMEEESRARIKNYIESILEYEDVIDECAG